MTFRAIVIDDMMFCRDLLTDFLEDRGYQVLCYPDITSCPLFPSHMVEYGETASYADFLLTDNRMPYMQGLDFLELQSQGECQIKIYGKAIFSAHWTQEELKRAEQLNCEIFHKPYDLSKLSRWLDKQEQLIPADRELLDLDKIISLKDPISAKCR